MGQANVMIGWHWSQRVEHTILGIGACSVDTFARIPPATWADHLNTRGVSGDEHIPFERFISAVIER
jgi:hypothetical protein